MKKGQSGIAGTILIVIGIILIVVSIPNISKQFGKLITPKYAFSIEPEKNSYFLTENIKTFYEIINNGDTTLVSKIRTEFNETCFYTLNDINVEIPPNGRKKDFFYITTKSWNRNECEGQVFDTTFWLDDISGRNILTVQKEINITKS